EHRLLGELGAMAITGEVPAANRHRVRRPRGVVRDRDGRRVLGGRAGHTCGYDVDAAEQRGRDDDATHHGRTSGMGRSVARIGGWWRWKAGYGTTPSASQTARHFDEGAQGIQV